MVSIPTIPNLSVDAIVNMTVAELVEKYPNTMSVLEPLGIDLCCGGAHPLGEALDLHGFDRAKIVPQVMAVVTSAIGK